MGNRGANASPYPEGTRSPSFNRGQGGGKGRGRGRGRGGRGAAALNHHLASEISLTPIDQAHDQPNTPFSPSPRPRGSRGSFRQQSSWTHPSGNRGSGSSTPRGHPARNKLFLQDTTRKGGLGFHLNTPSKFVTKIPSPSPKFYQSLPREKTDPRLFVPVKFVKATALTDKSLLDNPHKENSTSTSVEPGAKKEYKINKLSHSEPALEPLADSTQDDQWEVENIIENSAEHWQAQFPGIFNNASSTSAFPNYTPQPQHSHTSVPLKPSQSLDQSKNSFPKTSSRKKEKEPASNLTPQPASMVVAPQTSNTYSVDSGHSTLQSKGTQNDSTLLALKSGKEEIDNSITELSDSYIENQQSRPCVPTSSSDENRLQLNQGVSFQPGQYPTEILTPNRSNLDDIQVLKLAINVANSPDLPDQVSTVAASTQAPEALFFVDDQGDSQNIPSKSTANPIVLGQVLNEDSDDEDEVIVFQPYHCPSPSSQINNMHLYRTITDNANFLSHDSCKESHPANPKPSKPRKSKARKMSLRQKPKERRKHGPQDRSANYRPDADSGSDIDWGDEPGQDPNAASISTKVQAPGISRRAQRRDMKEKEEKELLDDYVKHTMMSEDDGSDESAGDVTKNDQSIVEKMNNDSFLKTFMRGMDPTESRHITIDELDQQAQAEKDAAILEEGGWQTDNSSSSLHNGIGALDLEISESDEATGLESDSSEEDCTADQISSKLLGIASGDVIDVDSDIDLNSSRNSHDFIKSKAKSEAKWRNKIVKASADDDIDKILENLQKELNSSSESDVTKSESDDEEELPTLSKDIFVLKKNRKSKNRKTGFSDEDNDSDLIEFIDDVQAQWKKDRSRKAERKKARADARLLSEPKSKKQRKKLDRRESRAGHNRELDIHSLDQRIRDFITFSLDKSSLALPPLPKKTRARVHELATLYGMTSRSAGTGSNRYPVLHRTQRTSIDQVNKFKHRRIVHSSGRPGDDDRFRADDSRSFNNGKTRSSKNKEGAIVGGGVAHIGAENIGFKLLTKMGWSLGQTMGNPENSATALQVPILAVMKSTKAGLGLQR